MSALVEALARAQAEFGPIVKSHMANAGSRGTYAYADLADVLAVVRPVLARHGIALVQRCEILLDKGSTFLRTELLCGDESIASVVELEVDGLNPQQVGSLRSYMRRYELLALCGVHPVGDDDDGATAATAPPRAERRTIPAGAASEKQQTYMGKLLAELVADPQHEAFIACVLDGEVPKVLNAAHCSRLIDALLAAKKGTWPERWTAAGPVPQYAEDEEPF